jgi:ribosomal protein S18 acetylase RimI-like enzyme
MSRLSLLTFGTEQYRIGSWRGQETVGYVAPLSPPEQLTRAGLEQALLRLRRRGFHDVLTAALTDSEQAFFRGAGFTVHERLHLLQHDLSGVSRTRTPATDLRRIRRWHHRALLQVDARAFDPFWKLDRANLVEAIQATPTTRLTGAFVPQLHGYAITGLAGEHGYLQRLAVDPDVQGRGHATALVTDALEWLVRRGATAASVNTQERNGRALALYEHLGFTHVHPGLAVLRCEMDHR